MFLARAFETSEFLAKESCQCQFLTGYRAYEDFCYLVEKYAKKNPSDAGDSFTLEEP